jgi:hypothetical protein
MKFEKVEDKRIFWKPEKEGESVKGRVIEINKNEYGNSLTIFTEDKKEIVTPSHRQLLSLIRNVKLNDIVKIVFVKKEVNVDKNDTYVYEVFKGVKDEQKDNK